MGIKYILCGLLSLFLWYGGLYPSTIQANPSGKEKITLLEAIEKISQEYDVYFTFDMTLVSKVEVQYEQALYNSAEDAISRILRGTGLKYQFYDRRFVILYKDDAKGLESLKQMSKHLNGLISEGEKKMDSTAKNDMLTVTRLPTQSILKTIPRVAFSVEGTVANQEGEPLIGVTVQVKGAGKATTTDARGHFTLNDIEANAVLILSYVGFEMQEVKVAGKTNLKIVMLSSTQALGEVVVVAYGTQKRVSVTGAVDGISKKAIEGRPVTNLSAALQGASPNLIIQQSNFEPGQGVNINIRGLGTLGNNTPLVVIDGIIGGDINLINPNDIESISVLKDAGSAAIYGSRSANGVLLITTKKGRKNSTPKVTYSGIYGSQLPRVTYKPVHAWENAYYKNVSLANSGLAPSFSPEQMQQFAAQGDGDWRVDNILRNAAQQSHTASVAGGGANNTYMVSLGYLNQDNNLVGPDYGYKRYNIRLNQTTDIGRLKINTILSYVKVQGKDHSYNTGTLVVDAGRVPLYYSFRDSLGNYLTNPVSAQFNPKAILEEGGYRKSNDDEIFGNLNAEFALTKDLKIRGVFGGTVRSNATFGRRYNLKFIPAGSYGDDLEVYNSNFKSLFTNLQVMAEYNRQFGDHDLRMLAGASNESSDEQSSQVSKTLVDPILGVPTTGTIVSPTGSYTSNQATTEKSLNSLFGRAGYAFKEKYFAEFNFRYDGSSIFPKNIRWGFFPSGSVAWRLTEEDFMSNIKSSVGDIKIRGSYGILGNQNVNAYQYQTTFFNYANAYAFNNEVVGGAGFSLGNPELTWERAATTNIGADVTLLKHRLELSFDYFDKTTSNILYPRGDVPQLFGAGFPSYNVAKVKNRGWEFKATYNASGRLFKQSISVNLADNLNELMELTSGAQEQLTQKEEFQLLRRVGQPITLYYGYKTNGFFQTLDDLNKYPKFANSTVTPGDLKFVDKNSDGVIDDKDKFILGNPFPRYTFGFMYNAGYKGFDLSLFIQGVGKRDAMIRGEQVEPFHVGYAGTMYTHQTDFWTPTHPNAKYPKLAEPGSASNANNYRIGSDIFLFNAAYVRLKNIQFGYSLPTAAVSKAGIQNVRIYFTAQNIVTLSKLNFLDPEITEFNNNVDLGAGANSARAYFLPVFYGGGIDITF